MAKTLGKLRQQTAKLRELDVPPDVSKGTKNFVKKHVYVVHPDANENDDDVFKAANVKRAKRAPDHGYEPGQDADIYENSWNELILKQDDARRAAVRGAISKRYVTDDPGFAKEPGNLAAAKALTKAGRDPALRKNFRGSAAVTRERRANTKAGLTNSYEPEGNELGEAKLTPERHAAAWLAANPKRAQRTRESFSKHMGDAGFVHFDTRPFKKGRDLGYDQVVGHQNNLLRSLPYNIGENVDKPRPLKKNGKLIPQDTTGYWKGTLELTPDMQDPEQKAAMARHPLNGKIDRMARDRRYKTEAYDDTNEFGETHLETRNFEHNYLHSHISDHIEAIHKTIQAHVQLMDSMNDHQHEGNFRQLLKTHDALEDLSHKIQKMHTNAKTRMGMHPKAEPVRDMSDRPLGGAAFPHAEGYEHIAAMSELDQTLLVNTYNSLSEDNQEKFLALAETPEGVDKLLDFAITNSKGIK